MALGFDEIARYDRQMMLPEWGAAGQERLRAACVTVLGRGPAAEAAILYLAGAGVGRLLVEDFVEPARALNPLVSIDAARLSAASDGGPPLVALVGEGPEAARIDGAEDRLAVGAAVAVEVLKRLLGLPSRSSVELPGAA